MISILIPTYKRPHLLLRALSSLQAQTYPNWEALVVDDGGGESEGAIESLGDARIRGFRNHGKGQVDARNTALSHAQGDFIGLLDDDDWLLDVHHLELAQQALQHETALLYRGGYLVQEVGGQEIGRTPFQYLATPERMRRDNVILATGVVYPKALHQPLGPFDPKMSDYWDWDWYLRVLAGGFPLVQLPGLGVAVSMHGANMSYGGRLAERQRNLDKLCERHGLVGVVLKDHGSLGKDSRGAGGQGGRGEKD